MYGINLQYQIFYSAEQDKYVAAKSRQNHINDFVNTMQATASQSNNQNNRTKQTS